MKYIASLILLLIIAISAGAQDTSSISKPTDNPGQHLINARSNFRTGLLLQAGGAGLMIISAVMPLKENQESQRLGLTVAGGVAYGVGVYFMVMAWNEIGIAGEHLSSQNQTGLNFGFQSSGIGISYKF
jgi:predicted membrane channel-forming protein YqfA (hemolysin III family)